MLKFKKPIFVILALLLLGGGAFLVWSQKEQPAEEVQPQLQEVTVAADLTLDYGDEKIATYSGVKVSEKTVLGLLLQAASDYGFEIDYNPPSGGMGAFVKSIGGVENTKEKFWQFLLNGEYGQAAMDQQEIKDGDLVEIKFAPFE